MYNKIFKNIDKFNRERRRLVVLVRYLKANVNVFLPKGEAGNTHTQHTISFWMQSLYTAFLWEV